MVIVLISDAGHLRAFHQPGLALKGRGGICDTTESLLHIVVSIAGRFREALFKYKTNKFIRRSFPVQLEVMSAMSIQCPSGSGRSLAAQPCLTPR
jgi:hypothetical protein